MDNSGLHGMQVLQPTCDIEQLLKVGNHVFFNRKDVPRANGARPDCGIGKCVSFRLSSTEKPCRFLVPHHQQSW